MSLQYCDFDRFLWRVVKKEGNVIHLERIRREEEFRIREMFKEIPNCLTLLNTDLSYCDYYGNVCGVDFSKFKQITFSKDRDTYRVRLRAIDFKDREWIGEASVDTVDEFSCIIDIPRVKHKIMNIQLYHDKKNNQIIYIAINRESFTGRYPPEKMILGICKRL